MHLIGIIFNNTYLFAEINNHGNGLSFWLSICTLRLEDGSWKFSLK